MSKIYFLFLFLFDLPGFSFAQNRDLKDWTYVQEFALIKNPATLFKTAKSEAERSEMKRAYYTMVGALTDLGNYRDRFLEKAEPINLFPTAYFHTTCSEMESIAAGKFKYPIEKMYQMIAFYDAYKWNRAAWDRGDNNLVENHWKQHFIYASQHTSCLYATYALSTGLAAHVQADLPRAIRYAYTNRYNKSIIKTDPLLLQDFVATNIVFKKTRQKTIADIALSTGCSNDILQKLAEYENGLLIDVNNEGYKEYNELFKILDFKEMFNDNDVIFLRQQAWNLAFSGKDIEGFHGWHLLGQPILNHQSFLQTGEKICATPSFKSPRDLYRYDTVHVRGNITNPVMTNISIKKNEYVYIEVAGKVKVGSYLGVADGAGLLEDKFVLDMFNKYSGHKHGSLMILLNSKQESCKRILDNLGSVYNMPLIGLDYGVQYVPGNYFIAEEDGKLSFDINDNDPVNNVGDFIVSVIRMRYEDHLSRNYFNVCPEKEPSAGKDCFNAPWEKESPKSWWYHGYNDSFRGGKVNAGCQCVYDNDELITQGKHMGSFDIGYWHFNGDITKPQANYYHLILDVIPHDLFTEKMAADIEYLYQRKVSCK